MAARLVSAIPKFTRSNLGILEESSVEIAHAIEEQAPRIGSLDLEVLRHDRVARWSATPSDWPRWRAVVHQLH